MLAIRCRHGSIAVLFWLALSGTLSHAVICHEQIEGFWSSTTLREQQLHTVWSFTQYERDDYKRDTSSGFGVKDISDILLGE